LTLAVGACTGVAARPYADRVPPGYSEARPAPLVLLLHGYTMSGAIQESYFAMGAATDRLGHLLAMPDGRTDSLGNRFWDAGPCCGDARSGDDDVTYLLAVLDDMAERYAVDAERVYAVGFSNGGFMAHRLACEHPERFAGIASFAGTTWAEPDACDARGAVDVLQIHGTADDIIRYDGQATPDAEGLTYASAEATVGYWASVNGCDAALVEGSDRRDLDADAAGDETVTLGHTCPDARAALWRMDGTTHLPTLRTPAWGDGILGWLTTPPTP
jgi:polyhydroxybutyrate depolymerase